jgi:uncharacterized protein YjeT (DUF2065 family)
MPDFGAAFGLVLAIEGSSMAGFTGSGRTPMAIAARETPAKLRGVGHGAALSGVSIVRASRWLLQAHFSGEVTSRRTDRRM